MNFNVPCILLSGKMNPIILPASALGANKSSLVRLAFLSLSLLCLFLVFNSWLLYYFTSPCTLTCPAVDLAASAAWRAQFFCCAARYDAGKRHVSQSLVIKRKFAVTSPSGVARLSAARGRP